MLAAMTLMRLLLATGIVTGALTAALVIYGNTLSTREDDERIADDEAHNFRSIHAGFFAGYRALIQFHEQHEADPAQTLPNRAL
jgi:hypothetical protein